MASTLYIQIPSKSVADGLINWTADALPFCLASAEKNILQQGRQNFSELAGLAQSCQQVCLLVAASDVSVFQVKVPPLPFPKLKLALPNLLEDQLLAESGDLIFAASLPVDGHSKVAVVSRVWLDKVLEAAKVLGARRITAHALSLNIDNLTGASSVVVESSAWDSNSLEIAVNQGDSFSGGLTVLSNLTQQKELDAQTLFDAMQVLLPEGDLQIFVDANSVDSLQAFAQDKFAESRVVQVSPLDWKRKIAGAFSPNFDLLATLTQTNNNEVDWQRWRWSIALVAAVIVVCLAQLNWQSWLLKSEANGLSTSLTSTYKTSFPNETVIRDPYLQMQQKINASRKLAGQSTNDDFLVLAGQFSQIWERLLGPRPGSSMSSIEYRERKIFVKPNNMAEVPLDKMRAALKEQGLVMEVTGDLMKISVDGGAK